MESISWVIVLSVFAIAYAAAVCALFIVARLSDHRKKTARSLIAEADTSTVFLFDDHTLVDASPQARSMMESKPKSKSDWDFLVEVLGHRFPTLDQDLFALAEAGTLSIPAEEDVDTRIDAEWWDGLARLTLIEGSSVLGDTAIDRHSLIAMESELGLLRAISLHTPFPVWKQAADGTITWVNRAYLALAEQVYPEDSIQSWPPVTLFELSCSALLPEGRERRLPLRLAGADQDSWYDCSTLAFDDEVLCFATDAGGIVRAEKSLRDFVQTLTKTFAHLPIGLAVFDRKRQLALFNPALTDLSTLPPDFLSVRPTLFSFLDALREKQMIPEPKNYKSWRQQMLALEAAAVDGTYEETWPLASGQTYRVTGRPHPDGAVAFLFEDISAEVSLTRRFRAELELGQAVVDAMDCAIAVFSSNGVLSMSNMAYADLWGEDPEAALGDVGINDSSRLWQSKCEPNPIWGDLRDFVGSYGERSEWIGDARLTDGRKLHCRFTPLSGGSTLVSFSVVQTPSASANVTKGELIPADV